MRKKNPASINRFVFCRPCGPGIPAGRGAVWGARAVESAGAVAARTLYVVATPIGNMGDVSPRARAVLAGVAAIAAEDTRVARRVLAAGAIDSRATLITCDRRSEPRAFRRIVAFLSRGESVALTCDAGTPGLSDPGNRVVAAVAETGFAVVSVPGASAITAALSIAGLPAHTFRFLGFLPRRPGPRRRILEENSTTDHTLVLFESPRRVLTLLEDILPTLGDRRCAICFELTKRFERVHRGWASDLRDALSGEPTPRGEATCVVAGNRKAFLRNGS